MKDLGKREGSSMLSSLATRAQPAGKVGYPRSPWASFAGEVGFSVFGTVSSTA